MGAPTRWRLTSFPALSPQAFLAMAQHQGDVAGATLASKLTSVQDLELGVGGKGHDIASRGPVHGGVQAVSTYHPCPQGPIPLVHAPCRSLAVTP